MIYNMENMIKILFEKGFTSEDINISLYNDKRILMEVAEPKIIISIDFSTKERIQYYLSRTSPHSSKNIGKKELFEILHNLPQKND